jgi:hypothetical protein
VTEEKSKDSPEMPNRLDTLFGCYGVTLTNNVAIWVHQYIVNGGHDGFLEGTAMIMDKSTGHTTLWSQEIFNYAR